MISILLFALLAAALVFALWQVYQENQKALARQAKMRSELIPLLNALIKAIHVETIWPTSRR